MDHRVSEPREEKMLAAPGYGFGTTMPLDPGRRAACREVIHAPLEGELATDACAYP